MRGDITRAERDYDALLKRIQRALKGRWVRDRDNDTGTIEDVHLNSKGVSCTIVWVDKGRLIDQKFTCDFVQW